MPLDTVATLRPRRGRPRKFSGPSRAVTLTLPEDVIRALEAIDPDVSRAVVRLTQPQLARRPHPPAELAVFGRSAVIVVNPTHALEERTGVSLVPLSDGRALIAFDRSITPASLELRIQDALDDARLTTPDKAIFDAIARVLRDARRAKGVSLVQRNIMVLEAERPARFSAAPRRVRRQPTKGARS
jgi:hypothetical protein